MVVRESLDGFVDESYLHVNLILGAKLFCILLCIAFHYFGFICKTVCFSRLPSYYSFTMICVRTCVI